MTLRVVLWICLGAFLALTLFAAVVKHVPVLGIQQAIAKRVEARWSRRGHRRLDKLHSKASIGE